MRSSGAFRVGAVEAVYLVAMCAAFSWPLLHAPAPSGPAAMSTTTAAAVVGAFVAIALGASLRSGRRGAGLYVSAAFVYLVLLSPMDRGLALRRPVAGSLGAALIVGAVVGLAGSLVIAQLIGSAPSRLAVGGLLCGAAVSASIRAVGLFAAGRHLGRARAWTLSALLAAWWALDTVLQWVTAPMTATGRLMVGQGTPWMAPLVIVPAAFVTFAAFRVINGASIEGITGRSAINDASRFSLAFFDVRGLLVAGRRGRGEQFRARPLARPPAFLPATPAVLRIWWSVTRWPGAMWIRLAGLAVVAGAALSLRANIGALAIGSVAMVLAALEISEPLAQHIERGPLTTTIAPRPHALAAKLVLTSAIVLISWSCIAVVVGAAGHRGFGVTNELAFLAAVMVALAGSVLLICQRLRPLVRHDDIGKPPEAVGSRVLVRIGAPFTAPAVTYWLLTTPTASRASLAVASTIVGVAALAAAALIAYVGDPPSADPDR